MKRTYMVLLVIFMIAIGLGVDLPLAFAQGCSVQLEMTPTPPFTLGTHVLLHVSGNCGTVRFEINGQARAEIGSTEQWETWKTEEWGSGGFEVCGVGRGDGGWENASRSCRSVYVEGGQAPPDGSQAGGNVRCWVNNFTVTPGSGPVGHTFQLAGQGQCDGNARAMRFTIDGSPFGEYNGNTHGTGWNSSGSSTGSHRLCMQITSGEWSEAAESCVSITLTSSGQASHDVSQGQPATNNQQGQTDRSNPENYSPPSSNNNSNNTSPNTATSESSNSNCNPLSRLQIGQTAVVSDATPDPLPMRSGPSVDHGILVNVPVRTHLTISGGPSCNGNLVWWQTQYSGQTGWVAEINGYNNRNLIADTASSNTNSNNTGSNASNTAGTGSSTADASCSNALRSTLSNGDRGRVTFTDGTPTALWDNPQDDVITRLPEGTEFDVISDPVCTTARYGHLWWVQVRTSGQTGWVAFGYQGGAYWVEPVPNESSEGTSRANTQTIYIQYAPWNSHSFRFVVDESNCQIINGAEVIANELSRFESTYDLSQLDLAFAVWYFAPDGGVYQGQIERFRQYIVEELSSVVPCSDFTYKIGNRTMDSSGLGNIEFAYYAARVGLPYRIEDRISNVEQSANISSFLQVYDNDDDLIQRLVGRRLAESYNRPPTAQEVIEIARRFNLR